MPHPYEVRLSLLQQTRGLVLDDTILTCWGPVMATGAEREKVKAQQIAQLDAQIAELEAVPGQF